MLPEIGSGFADCFNDFNFFAFLGFLTFRTARRFLLPEVRQRKLTEKLWSGETSIGDVFIALLFGFFMASISGISAFFITLVLIAATFFFVEARILYTSLRARSISRSYLVGRQESIVIKE
jgi:hypothetical protein